MSEALALAQKLGTVGFPTILVLILIGSYFDVWCWSRDRLKAETDGAEWKRMALRGIGMAESSMHLAKTRGPE